MNIYRTTKRIIFYLTIVLILFFILLLCHCTSGSYSPSSFPTEAHLSARTETRTPVIQAESSPTQLILTATRRPTPSPTFGGIALDSNMPTISSVATVMLNSPIKTATPANEIIKDVCPIPSIIGELPVYGSRLALSPDGNLIASYSYSSETNTPLLDVIDINTGQIKWSFEKPRIGMSETRSIAFSPDGSLVAAGGFEEIVQVWDLINGEELYRFGLDGPIFRVAFSSDGKLLSACTPSYDFSESSSVSVWSMEDGSLVNFLDNIPIIDLAFSPNEPVVAIALQFPYFREYISQTIVLWNIEQETTELLFDGQAASGVAFSHDGSLLAANVDGVVRLYNLDTRVELKIHDPFSGTKSLCRILFSSKNFLALFDMVDKIQIWDPERQLAYCYEAESIRDFVFTNDGTKMYVSETGNKIKVLNIVD